jgi:hypothetical protein
VIASRLSSSEDLFSTAFELFGTLKSLEQFIACQSDPGHELIFLPEGGGSPSGGFRISVNEDTLTGMGQIRVILERHERYEQARSLQHRVMCAGAWSMVNKHYIDIWGACEKYRKCYVGMENDLYQLKAFVEQQQTSGVQPFEAHASQI